eukprot:3483845-Rhodomonas_salina.1
MNCTQETCTQLQVGARVPARVLALYSQKYYPGYLVPGPPAQSCPSLPFQAAESASRPSHGLCHGGMKVVP